MAWLRSLLLAFLVVAVLPWGAYAADFGGAAQPALAGPSPVAAAPLLSDAGDGTRVRLSGTPAAHAAVSLCHGPAIPGSPCNPVPGVLPPAPVLPDAAARAAPFPASAVPGRDLNPAQDLPPPRPV